MRSWPNAACSLFTGSFHYKLRPPAKGKLTLSYSRAMTSVLVVALLSALLAAQTVQPSSSKSEKASTQKSSAERNAKRALTPQQEQAVLVLKTVFERAKNFAND